MTVVRGRADEARYNKILKTDGFWGAGLSVFYLLLCAYVFHNKK